MKRVIFFIDNEWAFGSIHYELCKNLYQHYYNCRVLPWNKLYSIEEMKELNDVTDIFVSNPHGLKVLEEYKIPLNKIVIIAHARIDLIEMSKMPSSTISMLKSYGCVSRWLCDLSEIEYKIHRKPKLTRIGINYDLYDNMITDSLQTVGYSSAYHEKPKDEGENIYNNYNKRGWLVKEIVESCGLKFKIANRYHNSFVTMPGFYKNIDCVITSSFEEGAGLPNIEGAAAGKLVITTEVGSFKNLSSNPCVIVPSDEKEFVERTRETLLFYMNNPYKYKTDCKTIRSYAKSFDWENHIFSWIECLEENNTFDLTQIKL